MPNRHSRLTVVTCADWAYHVHHAARQQGGSGEDVRSRLAELVDLAVANPSNPDGILPHILRVEAPALVVGDLLRQAAFAMLNSTVLDGTRILLVDGHSACAGIKANCSHLYRTDQSDLQCGMMADGAPQLAALLAARSNEPTRVICTYTEFGQPGEVLVVRQVADVTMEPPTLRQ